MISIEQVHLLETRIERVLRMLAELRGEKASLTTELQAANASLEETAGKLEESERARHAAEEKLRQFQAEIEEPFNRMLHQLDEFEEGEQPEAPQDSPEAADEAAEPEPAATPTETAAADEPAASADGAAPPDEAAPDADAGEQPANREGAELDIF